MQRHRNTGQVDSHKNQKALQSKKALQLCCRALNNGRSGGIRTRDPLLPKQMRYQAALRSDSSYSNLIFFRFWPNVQIFEIFQNLHIYEMPAQAAHANHSGRVKNYSVKISSRRPKTINGCRQKGPDPGRPDAGM
jgi:hypothetical protein